MLINQPVEENPVHLVRLGQRIEIIVLLGILLATASSSPALPSPPKAKDESKRTFAYDRSAGFDLQEVSVKEQDGVVIRDLNYAARTPERGRIKAYLVRPVGKGPHA